MTVFYTPPAGILKPNVSFESRGWMLRALIPSWDEDEITDRGGGP